MSKHPFEAEWSKEETKATKEVTRLVNQSLNSKNVLSDIDAIAEKSKAKGKSIPKEVEKSYFKFAEIAIKLIKNSFPGMDFGVQLTFSQTKEKWRAKAFVLAAYRKKNIGSKTHTIKTGETLFDIAKKHYGDGAYYRVIAEANPKKVKLNGDFIIAGMQINLPAVSVLDPKAVSECVFSARRDKEAGKSGKEIAYPWINIDATKSLLELKVTKAVGNCVVEFTINIKGNIKAERPGSITTKFVERDFTGEIKKAITKKLNVKLAFDPLNPKMSMSTTFTGSLGDAKYTVDSKLAAKAVFSSKAVSFKVDDCTYSGSLSAEVTARFLCVPSEMPPRVQILGGVNSGNAEADIWAKKGAVIIVAGGFAWAGVGVTAMAAKTTATTVSHTTAWSAGAGMALATN